jgi:hypothetical protein
VAVIELVSPGNKSSDYPLDTFVRKTVKFLRGGVHLLVIDPHPPGTHDPDGLHPLIWEHFGSQPFTLPERQDRLLAAYRVGEGIGAYLNVLGVGEPFPEMPLFLTPHNYLPVDLEASYLRAYELVPREYREELEA